MIHNHYYCPLPNFFTFRHHCNQLSGYCCQLTIRVLRNENCSPGFQYVPGFILKWVRHKIKLWLFPIFTSVLLIFYMKNIFQRINTFIILWNMNYYCLSISYLKGYLHKLNVYFITAIPIKTCLLHVFNLGKLSGRCFCLSRNLDT